MSNLTCRRRQLLLLCAACVAGLGASVEVAPPVELSAEAIDLIGKEAFLTRQLADLRRRLARAQRALARARQPATLAKLAQDIAVLEPQIRQKEAILRLQLPARQLRGLPVTALKTYVERLRRQIEQQGDQHLPQENGQPLYGATDIAFTVAADGSLAHLQVLNAVPRSLGLQAALLLQTIAPFEPFPPAVAAKVARISFWRSFQFDVGGEVLYRLRSRPASASPQETPPTSAPCSSCPAP